MPPHVRGTYLESCSCDSVCPCTTSTHSRPADTVRCPSGGPMELLSPLVGEMLGVERTTIEYAGEGTGHRTKVGDAIDIEIAEEVHQAGFGLELDNAGRNGHAPPFAWAA